jgi:hypothetical protein
MLGKRLKPARTVIAINTERIFPHPFREVVTLTFLTRELLRCVIS